MIFFPSSFYFLCIFHTGNVWFLSNKGEKLALSVTFSGAEVIKLIRDVNADTIGKVWGWGLARWDTIRSLTREKIRSAGGASQLSWVKSSQNTAGRTDSFSSKR